MTNDELRMTKEERDSNDEFELPHSSLIRHSDSDIRRSPFRRWLIVLAVAAMTVYGLLAAQLVLISRYQINPDGIAYIQVARHYAAGRLDLAVNSYWSPLLSWMLVPVVWAGGHGYEPMVVKSLNVLWGGLMAVGVAVLAWQFSRRASAAMAAGIFSLALAILMLPEPVTPDLMVTAILTWYFLAAWRLLVRPALPIALAAGALGGAAYLAKSYALPFVAAHLLATLLIAWRGNRRAPADNRRPLKPFLHAMAVFAIICLPWIAAISAHDGRLTAASSAAFARSWWSPVARPDQRRLPMYALHAPRPGRLTSWENPVEIPSDWPDLPMSSAAYWRHLRATIAANAVLSLDIVRSADRLSLLFLGLLLATAAACARRGRDVDAAPICGEGGSACRRQCDSLPGAVSYRPMPPWPWAAISAWLFISGYLPTCVEQRYFWPCYGLLTAIAAAVLVRLRLTAEPPDRESNTGRLLPWLMLVALCISGLAGAWRVLHRWQAGGWPVAWEPGNLLNKQKLEKAMFELGALKPPGLHFAALAHAAPVHSYTAPVVSNEWARGLFLCFWAEQPYANQFLGEDPDAIAAELDGLGPVNVAIFENNDLADELARDARFREIVPLSTGPLWLRVFEYGSAQPARQAPATQPM